MKSFKEVYTESQSYYQVGDMIKFNIEDVAKLNTGKTVSVDNGKCVGVSGGTYSVELFNGDVVSVPNNLALAIGAGGGDANE